MWEGKKLLFKKLLSIKLAYVVRVKITSTKFHLINICGKGKKLLAINSI